MSGYLLLAALAAGFVIVPLLLRAQRMNPVDEIGRRETAVQLHAQRTAELTPDLASESDAEDELQEALRDELGAVLLEEYQQAAPGTSAEPAPSTTLSSKAGRSRLVWAVVPAIPLLGALIYTQVADPALLDLRGAEAVMQLNNERDAGALESWRVKLEARVEREPKDSKSAYLLGHVWLKQGNYSAAASAFDQALQESPEDVAVGVFSLQAGFLASGGSLDEKARALADDLLERQPGLAVVLEIKALDAVRRNEPELAVQWLHQALVGSSDMTRQATLSQAIARVRASMPESGPGVWVDVQVEDAGQIPAHGTLFVIARPVGGGMPYAVARRPALLAPLRVRLDDLVSMSEARLLSSAENFEVVVRISATGDVMAAPSDWIWVSEPFESATLAPSTLVQATLSPPA